MIKLITYKYYSIPLANKFKWLTFEKGRPWVWVSKPVFDKALGWCLDRNLPRRDYRALVPAKIEPPEPGPDKDQIYWIG